MGVRRRPRQCPRCGTMNDPKLRECGSCGTRLVRPPFRMDRKKISLVHALAAQKGLDDEFYRLRLQSVGVESCKKLKRNQFNKLVTELQRLPDAVKRGTA